MKILLAILVLSFFAGCRESNSSKEEKDKDIVTDSEIADDEDFYENDYSDSDLTQDIEIATDSEIISDTDKENDTDIVPECDVPQAPVLEIIHKGAVLNFTTKTNSSISVSVAKGSAQTFGEFEEKSSVTFSETGTFTVFAKLNNNKCLDVFSAVYEVRETYPPKAGDAGTTAVPKNDPAIVAWAEKVESINYGESVTDDFKTPEKALGKASDDAFDIVSLGDKGEIVLSFKNPISDNDGYDFAVFENSFSDLFLELAFVEVSSNGSDFVRFFSSYLGTDEISPYGTLDPTLVGGFAGNYRQGFGSPFDLSNLKNTNEVAAGLIDLQKIYFIKIIDISGNGEESDSFGNTIFDPYPTKESAGFDLDAVGVIKTQKTVI